MEAIVDLRVAALLLAAVIVMPIIALAQEKQRGMAEMRTDERFAALAADAQRLEEVRANLQQALNCLEGSQPRRSGCCCENAFISNLQPMLRACGNRIRLR